MGSTNRPAVMPLDAWREGETFVLEFDLPGVNIDSIDLDVERNVLTVRAERPARNGDWEMLASERSKRSEEHTSELQSLMRISYAVFCLKKKKHTTKNTLKLYTTRKT